MTRDRRGSPAAASGKPGPSRPRRRCSGLGRALRAGGGGRRSARQCTLARRGRGHVGRHRSEGRPGGSTFSATAAQPRSTPPTPRPAAPAPPRPARADPGRDHSGAPAPTGRPGPPRPAPPHRPVGPRLPPRAQGAGRGRPPAPGAPRTLARTPPAPSLTRGKGGSVPVHGPWVAAACERRPVGRRRQPRNPDCLGAKGPEDLPGTDSYGG